MSGHSRFKSAVASDETASQFVTAASSVLQVDEKHACKKFACAFQACLKQHGFQNMHMCQREIDDLKRCCERYNGISVHCSFPEIGLGEQDDNSSDGPGKRSEPSSEQPDAADS